MRSLISTINIYAFRSIDNLELGSARKACTISPEKMTSMSCHHMRTATVAGLAHHRHVELGSKLEALHKTSNNDW